MTDILFAIKLNLKTYLVNSLYKKKNGLITKNNWYRVYHDTLNLTCNCVFMQQYNFDTNKVCKHINFINEIEIEQLNTVKEILKCNLADKPLDYDYPLE